MKRTSAILLAAAELAAACGRGDRTAGWQGTIDTLPNHAVVVHNAAPAWDSASAWRIATERRIGSADGEGPAAFAQIGGVTLDPAGRMYVLERQAQEIRVFDSSGAYLRTIGRKGKGPGEFDQPIGMAWDRLGRLWVVDQSNARYTVFDTSGRMLLERRRPISGWFTWQWSGGLDAADRVVEWFRRPGATEGDVLVRYDSTLAHADTFALPAYTGELFRIDRQSMHVSASVPFTPTLVWRFDPRGYVWSGLTAPYRIAQRRLGGDTVRIIELAYTPLPVSGAEKDSAIGRFKWFTDQGGTVDRGRIPGVKPAFTSFTLDDAGNLWVAPVAAGADAGHVLDVFSPDGRYYGRVHTEFRIVGDPLVRGDRMIAVTVDENDVPAVVSARIRRPPQPGGTP